MKTHDDFEKFEKELDEKGLDSPLGRYEAAHAAWKVAVRQSERDIAAIRAGVALKRLAMEQARERLQGTLPKRPRGRPRQNS